LASHQIQPQDGVAKLLRRGIEHLAGLLEVRLGVGVDLGAGEHRAGLVHAGRVAHAGGVIADDHHGLVAEVLELAHLAQDDGMAEVDVRRGGVQAELDAQLPADYDYWENIKFGNLGKYGIFI